MTALDAQVTLERGAFRLDVSLRMSSGETVVLVGPNGAGKTTLLRVLAGLESFHAGRITLDGRLLEERSSGDRQASDHAGARGRLQVPVEQRQIGIVFQDHALFPHLSALDNVAFGLRAKGRSRAVARAEARGWLSRLGIEQQANARPAELSGGQAQRVALGRALAIEPRMLLLDEPLSALDATTRLETRRLLRALLDTYEGVCLVVTHDQREAMALADRVVVIQEGSIVQQGSIREISERPRTSYVADLLGVNLLRGVAAGDRVAVGLLTLTTADPAEGEVFAIVHPRAVALHRGRPEGTPRNVWQGFTEGYELEGSRARVRVGGPIPIVAEVTPAAVDELGLVEGGPVWVSIKATEITVYPA